jgi:flagellar export protein FliJ
MTRLDNIIRLRKWELDEKRRHLAVLLGERDNIIGAIEAISDEIADQARHTGLEVASVTLGSYLEAVRVRQGELATMLQKKEEEVLEHQDVVAESFRELKTFEIARERELSRIADAEAKEEQAAFDELGIQNHARAEALADTRHLKMRRS